MISDVNDRAEYFRDQLENLDGNMVRCPSCGDMFPSNGRRISEDPALKGYLDDCMDVTYKVDSNGEYLSCCILKEYGGPNTYIDTGNGTVEVYWGGDRGTAELSPDILWRIDSLMRDRYLDAIGRRGYR